MSALNVLLISNRPSVHAFLHEHGARSIPRIIPANLPLTKEAVAQHTRAIKEADVAMIDVGADPDAAVDVQRALHAQRPDLRVLAVVCCPNPTMPWHVRDLLQQGVNEMLDAQTTPAELVDRLVALVHGEHATRVALHREFGIAKTWTTEPPDQQQEHLLELVAAGLSDIEIGVRLQMGERTVREHVRDLRQSLQLRNREELAAWAGAHGYYRPRVRQAFAR